MMYRRLHLRAKYFTNVYLPSRPFSLFVQLKPHNVRHYTSEFVREKEQVRGEQVNLVNVESSNLSEAKLDKTKPYRLNHEHWLEYKRSSHKKFFDTLSKDFNIQHPDDWYKITEEDLKKYPSIKVILKDYSGSFALAVSKHFPNYEWKLWKFFSLPQKYWSDIANQRKFWDDLFVELKLSSLDDWYKVPRLSIIKPAGRFVTYYYKGSIPMALQAAYPEFNWEEWKFTHARLVDPVTTFDKVGKLLGVNKLEDWYNINAEHVKQISKTLLRRWGGSLQKALKEVYPEYNWEQWRFARVERNYWSNINNQREYMNWLSKKLGIRELSDWYNISPRKVHEDNSRIMRIHHDSLYNLLKSVYPDYKWELWKFEFVKRFPIDDEVVKNRVYEAAKYFGVEDPNDWYRIKVVDLLSKIGYNVIQKAGGIHKALKLAYPSVSWNVKKFSSRRKIATQRWLKVNLSRLFPNHEILEEYRPAELPIELDLYIPSLNTAFEYHGIQHYTSSQFFGEASERQKRDKEKRDLCKKHSIHLVEVDYTWDKDIESLRAIIAKSNPPSEVIAFLNK